MKLPISLFFIFSFSRILSQYQEDTLSSYVYYSDDPILNILMVKVAGQEDHYKASFPFSSCDLYFYKDSTFLFYYVDMENYKMALGSYSRKEALYIIRSDSTATTKAISDRGFYKNYFKFKAPVALKITRAAFFLDENLMIPFHNSQAKEKIELFSSAEKFVKRTLKMTVFSDIHYNLQGTKIVVDYDVFKKNIFPLDSLWGFMTFKKGILQAYRVTPKGFNWYGIPGILVVQTDPFIIYTVGEGRAYSYFSRDLNSKIYPLTYEKLKKEFKENAVFTDILTKEFGPRKALNIKGTEPGSYKISEIYKSTLSEKLEEEK